MTDTQIPGAESAGSAVDHDTHSIVHTAAAKPGARSINPFSIASRSVAFPDLTGRKRPSPEAGKKPVVVADDAAPEKPPELAEAERPRARSEKRRAHVPDAPPVDEIFDTAWESAVAAENDLIATKSERTHVHFETVPADGPAAGVFDEEPAAPIVASTVSVELEFPDTEEALQHFPEAVRAPMDGTGTALLPRSKMLDNAVATYLAWAGGQLGAVCGPETREALLRHSQQMSTLDDVAVSVRPTGPNEDAKQLVAAGLRAPDPDRPTHVVCSPPCVSGERCIGKMGLIKGGPVGGVVLMGMMSTSDLAEHERRGVQPTKGSFCFLCTLYVVHRYVTSVKFSDVPVRRTCVVSTVCARLGAEPGTPEALDCYNPALVLHPSESLPCGFIQPIPLLRFACLKFVKYGPRETEWRVDNSAYLARPPDPVPRPLRGAEHVRRTDDPGRFFGGGMSPVPCPPPHPCRT